MKSFSQHIKDEAKALEEKEKDIPEEKRKDTLAKRVRHFKAQAGNYSLLQRVFDIIDHHDAKVTLARFEEPYKKILAKAIKNKLNPTEENPRLLQELEEYFVPLREQACRDVLNEEGELLPDIVSALKIKEELPAEWKTAEAKKAMSDSILYAYMNEYTTGRIYNEYVSKIAKTDDVAAKALSSVEMGGKKVCGYKNRDEQEKFAKDILIARGNNIIADNINLRIVLKNDATSKRTELVNELKQYWLQRVPQSAANFALVCKIVQSVLSIRQKYDIKKSPIRQKGKKKDIMSAVENKLLELLKMRGDVFSLLPIVKFIAEKEAEITDKKNLVTCMRDSTHDIQDLLVKKILQDLEMGEWAMKWERFQEPFRVYLVNNHARVTKHDLTMIEKVAEQLTAMGDPFFNESLDKFLLDDNQSVAAILPKILHDMQLRFDAKDISESSPIAKAHDRLNKLFLSETERFAQSSPPKPRSALRSVGAFAHDDAKKPKGAGADNKADAAAAPATPRKT